MSIDELDRLLKRVDQSVAQPVLPSALLARVLETARRRRLTRRGIAVAVLALMISPVWFVRDKFNRHGASQSPPVVAVFVSESFEQLEFDAQLAQRTGDAIVSARRSASSATVRDDPLRRMHEQIDQTALMLVGSGDRLFRSGKSAEAALDYQQAQKLFPGTPAADIAEQRLRKIHS